MYIGRIEVGSTLVGVQSICCLVVAGLVQCAQVIPDLGNVGIQSDSTGVRVERVTVLVDLVIQHTDAAPESRVPSITVHGLLVRLVRLGVLLLRHVTATEQVPALCIGLIRSNRLLQIFDSLFLASIVGALLMV